MLPTQSGDVSNIQVLVRVKYIQHQEVIYIIVLLRGQEIDPCIHVGCFDLHLLLILDLHNSNTMYDVFEYAMNNCLICHHE